jgi:hypothetical protein
MRKDPAEGAALAAAARLTRREAPSPSRTWSPPCEHRGTTSHNSGVQLGTNILLQLGSLISLRRCRATIDARPPIEARPPIAGPPHTQQSCC